MKKVTDAKVKAIQYLLGDSLRTSGFKKGPLGLNRTVGDRVDSVNFSHRKYSAEDRAMFSVHVSVGFKGFARFMKDAPEYGLGEFNTVRPQLHGADLGSLDPSVRSMKEWPVTTKTSVRTLGHEVLQSIRRFAFPFFEEFSTIEKVVAVWAKDASLASKEAILTVAVHWFQGHRDQARAFVDADIRALTPLVKDTGGDPRFTWKCFLEFLERKDGSGAGG